MTKKEALEGSIKKWKKIIEDRRSCDNGTANCTLCQKYRTKKMFFNECPSCPVSKETGEDNCVFSPYEDWTRHLKLAHGIDEPPFRRQKDCPECLRLAKKELAFLESLR